MAQMILGAAIALIGVLIGAGLMLSKKASADK